MTTHELARQPGHGHARDTTQASAPPTTHEARLTAWAGWWMVGIAAVHVVFWSVLTGPDWGAWAAGDLWGAEPVTERGYRLHYGYWALVGSFAVPLFLLGLVTVHLTRRFGVGLPRYVTWVVLGWVVLASLLMEPNGFPLGFIPVALLLRAQYRSRGAH